LEKRDESRLLIYQNEIITEDTYKHVAKHLSEKSLLVFNNTKVVEARLIFHKSNGTPIELFCLEPSEIYTDITSAMLSTGNVVWKCMVGGAKKWKEGLLEKSFFLHDKTYTVFAQKIEAIDGKFLIKFSWEGAIHFSEIIEQIGNIPLPPYIQRHITAEDKERYQTTYAKEEGSVAAPTAGLHFNEKIFESLATKKIESAFITLHVGAGTFLPVKTENINDHPMHAEFFEVQKSVIEFLLKKEIEKENLDKNEKALPIISVGTTTLRTIESLYWLGVKIIHAKKTLTEAEFVALDVKLLQWDAYELSALNVSNTGALNALLERMELKKISTLITTTQLMIVPGYSFKICNGLITNFHQPKSTLLLIIAAITGNDWKTIYQHAIDRQYRFLSYGDGSLFWIN
jgi:S-adenosylmethionine:tRNA ribosyltransferase-isomerase